jgi:hypothetical protein
MKRPNQESVECYRRLSQNEIEVLQVICSFGFTGFLVTGYILFTGYYILQFSFYRFSYYRLHLIVVNLRFEGETQSVDHQ